MTLPSNNCAARTAQYNHSQPRPRIHNTACEHNLVSPRFAFASLWLRRQIKSPTCTKTENATLITRKIPSTTTTPLINAK
ncbi:hypothetical protein EYC84_004781 [Monilinia fructicola]|uniref:Uncharacterized protein n=1 Tax=Monilinia fructicola TaxID=38448 RepID=A0A5M9K1I9_MONFR|nr:hypothetical protein EYC84_004781 [Monilinia fructicola]